MKFDIHIQEPVTIQKTTEPEIWWPPKPASVGDYLVFITFIFAVVSYLINQKINRTQSESENRWKRIEFIFNQLEKFENNLKNAKAIRLLSEQDRDQTLDRLFPLDDYHNITLKDKELRSCFDSMFGHLEQIAYAKINSTISNDDMNLLEWYFNEIIQHKGMKNYIKTYYPNALKVGAEVSERLQRQIE